VRTVRFATSSALGGLDKLADWTSAVPSGARMTAGGLAGIPSAVELAKGDRLRGERVGRTPRKGEEARGAWLMLAIDEAVGDRSTTASCPAGKGRYAIVTTPLIGNIVSASPSSAVVVLARPSRCPWP